MASVGGSYYANYCETRLVLGFDRCTRQLSCQSCPVKTHPHVRPTKIHLGQLSLASLRGRLIEYQLRLGYVTSAGWQVTLCDPIWHVSSRSGVATLRTAIHLLLTYLHQSRFTSPTTATTSARPVPELSMGPFCVTRSNPTYQLTDPTQTNPTQYK